MSINTHGTNSLVERLDARRWTTLESGGDSLATSFVCRTTLATGFVTQLISSGHPSYPAMRCQSDGISTADAYTGMSEISVTFNGVRSATTFSSALGISGRIARSRPINAVQSEIEIRAIQNYVPRLNGPTAILLDEIPVTAATYPTIFRGETVTKIYQIYPVIESVEFVQLADSLYDCTYYVTTRECISSIASNKYQISTGYTLAPNFTSRVLSIEGSTQSITWADTSVYFPNLPTLKIRMNELQAGNGLDKLAATRGKLIRQKYIRITDASGEFVQELLFNGSAGAGLSAQYIPIGVGFMGPPRLLPEASNETGQPL